MNNSDRWRQVTDAISVDQMLLRTLAAVLITREVKRSDDADAALHEITEQWHRAIDFYGTTAPVPEAMEEQDKEKARVHIDLISEMVKVLRLI
jgi:hypothetical protein